MLQLANIAIAVGFGLFYLDLIFQIRRLLATRSSRDVSARGVAIRLAAAILFQIKYFAVNDTPLMMGGAVYVVLVAIYTALAFAFRKSV